MRYTYIVLVTLLAVRPLHAYDTIGNGFGSKWGADPNAGNGIAPLHNLMLYTRFGVGVNDRTAATPRYVNNASWSDGTPT